MTRRLHPLPWIALLLLGACSANGTRRETGGSTPEASTPRFSSTFEGEPETAPNGWRAATTNGDTETADGIWRLRVDRTAPSPPTVLELLDARGHSGSEYNLFRTSGVELADVDLTVALHARSGVEDQGGGPAWRVAGGGDYYVARWNPLEDNFRVYSVVGGDRRMLASATVAADPATWHEIRVRQVGSAITCWFDGAELLHAEDAKLPGPGGVGLWTKADAQTAFDDLFVHSVP
jgi:hypothetical protein